MDVRENLGLTNVSLFSLISPDRLHLRFAYSVLTSILLQMEARRSDDDQMSKCFWENEGQQWYEVASTQERWEFCDMLGVIRTRKTIEQASRGYLFLWRAIASIDANNVLPLVSKWLPDDHPARNGSLYEKRRALAQRFVACLEEQDSLASDRIFLRFVHFVDEVREERTIRELPDMLKEHSLPVSGTKDQLVQQLVRFFWIEF